MGADFTNWYVPKLVDLLPSTHTASDLRVLRDLGGLPRGERVSVSSPLPITFSLMIDTDISFVLL
jgi:hypothetical protein